MRRRIRAAGAGYRPAGRESLNGHSLAPTPTTITGRGHHLLYRHVATIRGTHGGVLPGVDTRGSGGYVIAPPSVHPSGRIYFWAPGMSPDDLPLADPPPWLVDLLRQIERRREAPDPEGDDPILVALRDRGLLKSAKAGCPGVWHVTCPWTAEHTDGVDDGAAYFAPHFDGRDKPGFKCHHGHCDERTIRDLLRVLRHEAPTPEPSTSVREDADGTEDGLALSFAARHAEQLRYVVPWARWLQWTGAKWRADDTLRAYDLVRELCRGAGTKNARKASVIAAVERLARTDLRVVATAEQWDADPWVLNTPSGTVELRTGALRAHRREDYCTRSTAVGPGGECARWLRFLDEITGGDEALAEFLARVAGYAVTGSTREHALFFAYGTGANGKGVFLGTLAGVLADYAVTSSMETFTEAYGERHPTDIAMLRGARLVVAQETESGRRWAESRIKQLTGGDRISARFMRQDFSSSCRSSSC